MQPGELQLVLNRPAAEAEAEEIGVVDDPPLPTRQVS
jgi:hypothetical protein